jgi:Bacterial Ig-like domain (group 3)
LVAANCVSNQCGSGAGELGVLLNTSLTATMTTLTSSANPSQFGQAVTFTATVTAQQGKGTPTGTVSFYDGTTNMGNANLNSSGVATLTTSTLSVGTHSMTATYNGDTKFAPSTSPVLYQVVEELVVSLFPASLTFPDQVVFTTSPAQQVTLTNTGNGVVTINHIGVTGPFRQTNNCPNRLNPGANCAISVKFHPITKGVLHGAVTVSDNASGSPQKVPLMGSGTFVQLTPAKLNFGTQPVGTRSLAKKITLTNKGSATVNISGIAITGADAGDFAETNTCGKSVVSGASCFIKVTFKPLVKGKRTADVSVYDDGGGSPQKAALFGTGT